MNPGVLFKLLGITKDKYTLTDTFNNKNFVIIHYYKVFVVKRILDIEKI